MLAVFAVENIRKCDCFFLWHLKGIHAEEGFSFRGTEGACSCNNDRCIIRC